MAGAWLPERALGAALFFNGRAPEAEHRLARALGLLAKSPDLAREPRNLTLAAIAASWLDRLEYGLDIANRAIETASAPGRLQRPRTWARDRRLAHDAPRPVARGVRLCLAGADARPRDRRDNRRRVLPQPSGVHGRRRWQRVRLPHSRGRALALATARGIISQWHERAVAVLDLELRRSDEAARRLEAVESLIIEVGYCDRGANLVDAYCRLARPDTALAVFDRLPGSATRRPPR